MGHGRKMALGLGACLCLFAIGWLAVLYGWGNPGNDGRVLNIYCWDDSFRTVMEQYYPAYDKETERIGDVQVHWVLVPETENLYQMALDQALADVEDVPADERVDMFLVEADFVRRYTATSEVAVGLDELGITAPELADQFPYTRELAMDAQGVQRGISWQACPGVMVYRRDIAKKVWGTDEPEAVQQYVRDWRRFEEAAGQLRQAGYRMLPGYFDTYRVFASNASLPWLNDQRELQLDPGLRAWQEQTKRFAEQGFLYPNNLWDKSWNAQVCGDVFCYFGPAWLIAGSLERLSRRPAAAGAAGTYGEWAVCQGPQVYFWGGSWICAARGTDNSSLVVDIMRTLCCTPETAQAMAHGRTEFVNSQPVMQALAADASFGTPFLGGQNPYAVMYPVAENIQAKNMTAYDQGCHETFQTVSRRFFMGEVSAAAAWQEFLASIQQKYPELRESDPDFQSSYTERVLWE